MMRFNENVNIEEMGAEKQSKMQFPIIKSEPRSVTSDFFSEFTLLIQRGSKIETHILHLA